MSTHHCFRILFCCFMAAALAACSQRPKTEPSHGLRTESLMLADQHFSALCKDSGYKLAYARVLDSTAVLLRTDAMPMREADIVRYMASMEDTSYRMEWEPYNAEISADGDLGYTYGVYALWPNGYDTTFYGNYVSVWKKNNSGEWKLMLNSSNNGLGTAESPE